VAVSKSTRTAGANRSRAHIRAITIDASYPACGGQPDRSRQWAPQFGPSEYV